MPSCTGNDEKYDVWLCPYCPKRVADLQCYTWMEDGKHVRYRAPCTFARCVRAGAHFDDCGRYVQHLIEQHGYRSVEC